MSSVVGNIYERDDFRFDYSTARQHTQDIESEVDSDRTAHSTVIRDRPIGITLPAATSAPHPNQVGRRLCGIVRYCIEVSTYRSILDYRYRPLVLGYRIEIYDVLKYRLGIYIQCRISYI